MIPPPSAVMGRRRRAAVPLVLAGLSMIGPFTIDTPFPAFGRLQDEFGVGPEATQQLVSVYLLAFALMSVLHGPLSDALGRRRVIFGGLGVYAVASVGCALAPSMEVLLAFRVLQGLSAGGGVIVSRVVIRDLFEGAAAQRLMSRVTMIFGVAPAVAPVVGGWLVLTGSWRVIFWFLVAFAVALVAVVAVVLPETHPPERRTPLRLGPMVRDLATVARSVRWHRVAWAGSFLFGGYFLYIGAAAIVVVDLLGLGENDFWMLFLPLIAGMVTGSWLSGRAADRMTPRRLVGRGLGFAVASAVLNVALTLWSPTQGLPYAVLAPALLGVSVGAVFPVLQLAPLDMFPEARGAAASATTVTSLVLNGLAAGLLAPLATRSLTTMAVVSLALVLVGACFWLWHLSATTQRPTRRRA
ncbi:MAG TPA: multidrug effflux MFS transporter [Dermatophilaceae bacterium]|nr:multidrug effflux MFS transporter [Dermatophilaceae bacterium]